MSIQEQITVLQFGAVGDGIADDTKALQDALDSGAKVVYFPTGLYRVTATLRVHSHTQILAADTARIYLCGSTQKHRGDFLLTNSDPIQGNVDITVSGGVWDGNHNGAGNAKPDIFDENGYSGTALHFYHVKNLCLTNLTVANSVTYNIRLARIADFRIENINFVSDRISWNQDGIHFGGDVRRGQVRNIRALSCGQTNDDLIALNADDCVTRVENYDLPCGDIEDITFEDIFAENCHTIIRILSESSTVRNIHFKNVFGGYRCFALNIDGGRYMRTPLFQEDARPEGVGHLENITVENMTCYPCRFPNQTVDPANEKENSAPRVAILLESHAKGLHLTNFRLTNRMNLPNPSYALRARNLLHTVVTADGERILLDKKSDHLLLPQLQELTVDRTEDA